MKFPRHAIPTPLEFAGFCLMVVLAAIFWPVRAKADHTQSEAQSAWYEAVTYEANGEPAYTDVRNMGISLHDEIEGQNNLGWQLWQAYLNLSISESAYNAGLGYFNDAKDQYNPWKLTASNGQQKYELGSVTIDDGDNYYDQGNWEWAYLWYRDATSDFQEAATNFSAVSPHWHSAETYIGYCYYIIYTGSVPPPPGP